MIRALFGALRSVKSLSLIEWLMIWIITLSVGSIALPIAKSHLDTSRENVCKCECPKL